MATIGFWCALASAMLVAGCACCANPCCPPTGADLPAVEAPAAEDAPPGPTDADKGTGPAIVGSGGRYDG